ncbi:MAG: aminotransferase class I/II-fold pyridoxal phosphate-dependent enzyme, partial [Anaerolineaceae bacterium]|nr:aminotransferase class I/II-fold pyridoxal phosphate-dependent enzyme [Anaerolineaceae bacterium]
NTNVTPIYQSSIYRMPDVATGAAIFDGKISGYVYSRLSNPTLDQVGQKLAILEGIDLLRANPDSPVEEVVRGKIFASGMAAITSCILARVQSGQAIIAPESLYSRSFGFLNEAVRHGVKAVWVKDTSPEQWEAAFAANPDAVLAYVESPVNPTLALVDLETVTEIAHQHNAWVLVDNTFATPYCQRPLALGADIIVHSTTKYLNGHGLIIGGAAISTHTDFMDKALYDVHKTFGGTASPFDTWLLNNGLKTFEIRMQRQCENAMKVAAFLEEHPKVARVFYPGLPSHPDHELAKRQMTAFSGIIAFELKGGLSAGESMMNNVHLCRLAVSLGHLDTLIEHPATMTQSNTEPEVLLRMGISDGLVRLSVGIENVEDIIADLDQAMAVHSGAKS